MPEGTLYSTWKQDTIGEKPAIFLQVIHISFSSRVDVGKEFTGRKLTLLNLDGNLNTSEIESEKFDELVNKNAIVRWIPKQ